MIIDLNGVQVHAEPEVYLHPGSYFDTLSGSFVLNIKGTNTHSSSEYGFGFHLYFHYSDGSWYDCGLYKPGAGHNAYINIMVTLSGTAPVSGRGSQCCLWMKDCSAFDGLDTCLNNTKRAGWWDLISPPKISDLTNANKYNNADYISASETSISVNFRNASITDTATIIAWMIEGHTGWNSYTLPKGQHIGPGGWKTFKIPWTGFQPGTSYKIYVNLENSAGPGTDPSFLTITIRTLHSRPVLSISHDHLTQSGLEDITISWESNKNIQEIQYTIDGSEWRTYDTGLDLRSGTITIEKDINNEDLMDNSQHIIQVSVKSTNTYDYRWDATGDGPYQSITGITDIRANLEDHSPRDLITGERLHIQKNNESGNRNEIRLKLIKDNVESDWKTGESPSNDYYISFTQDEWDAAYKRFITPANFSRPANDHNTVQLHIIIVTFGREREYTKEHFGLLILNGNMLTTYTNVNGVVKRGKVWTRVGNEVKRGIPWITTATGHWRRGI